MAFTFSDNNFEQEVLKAEGPVLVDFYADWCGPCKMIAPVIQQLADEMVDKVKIGKLNVDNNPDTTAKYRVMTIPSLLIFKNGEVVDTVVGVQPKESLEAKLNAVI